MGWSKDLVGDVTSGMRSALVAHQALDLDARLALVSRFMARLVERREELMTEMMRELARSRVAVEEEWSLCEQLFAMLPGFCRDALGEKTELPTWDTTPVIVNRGVITLES